MKALLVKPQRAQSVSRPLSSAQKLAARPEIWRTWQSLSDWLRPAAKAFCSAPAQASLVLLQLLPPLTIEKKTNLDLGFITSLSDLREPGLQSPKSFSLLDAALEWALSKCELIHVSCINVNNINVS